MRQSYSGDYEDVEALRLQFEEFRNRHGKRTRFPKELWRRPPKLTNQAITGTGELLNRTVQEPSASGAWMLVLAANRSIIFRLEGGHYVRF